jgi:DNA-binding beta-propeller fold protein YncE
MIKALGRLHIHSRKAFVALAILSVVGLHGVRPALGADLIVSGNDAKFVREGGVGGYPEGVGPDTLSVIDASVFPPKVVDTVSVQHTLSGPPQEVAITPNGQLAFVSAPTSYDYDEQALELGEHVQVVDLTRSPSQIVARLDIGSHPQAVAISPAGNLALVTTVAGTVAIIEIENNEARLTGQLKISDGRLSGVSFTHDGIAALVGLRDEQGIVVLNVEGTEVTTDFDRISTGVAPYAIDVSSDGQWAVVGNAGLAGLGASGLNADVDTFTLIDVSSWPFRAVQHVTVPSIPEGVAISPDGRWIAVQSMNGSNLPPDAVGYNPVGSVLLYEIKNGRAVLSAELPSGEASQGIVFTADSQYLLVQFFTEQEIAVFSVNEGEMEDTGERIPVAGGPASIRSMPR